MSDLDKIVDAYKQSDSLLMVGFNRRFSKYSTAVKEILLNYNEPKFITYNVNAGHLPNDHWLHDPSVGGGRIIGECCHFIDLCRFFIGDRIKEVVSRPLRLNKNPVNDSATIILSFNDGSVANINYFSNSATSIPKEVVDVHFSNKSLSIINFKN